MDGLTEFCFILVTESIPKILSNIESFGARKLLEEFFFTVSIV